MTLQQQQQNFCSFLRGTDQVTPPENLNHDHAMIYKDLIFNNIESLLTGNFPVLHEVLTENHWHALIREFIRDYPAKTPLFHKIGKEFTHFLSTRKKQTKDPVFLTELATYEYRESAIFIADTDYASGNTPQKIDPKSLLTLSSTTELHSFDYPVHKISQDFQPSSASDAPHYLLLFRDEALNVRFFECNALSYCLLEILQGNDAHSLLDIVQFIHGQIKQNESGGFSLSDFLKHALDLLHQLNELNVIRSIIVS